MGREIRMVPPNWEHPKNERGQLQPMHNQNYDDARREWLNELAKWEAGERPDYFDAAEYPNGIDYWEWETGSPDRAYYRPWKDEEATWFQVWETVTEGTPVSPPFASREELVDYLATHGDAWDQSRGDGPWSRQNAEKFVMGTGWVPSGMMFGGRMYGSREIPVALPTERPHNADQAATSVSPEGERDA